MQIQVLKSKIHRVKVTDADLNYIGSITIDRDLMDGANLIAGEKVQVVNINNGERLETYVIPGKRKTGEIALNGPAARRVAKGDIVIIISYAQMDFEEAKSFLNKLSENLKDHSNFKAFSYYIEHWIISTSLTQNYNIDQIDTSSETLLKTAGFIVLETTE
mgnify:CR=1 FL=1